ncbi:2-C-methyl-D-erythritol 4-phosphate cytidylyltransferase [Microbacterium sp. STN6]|uniref:2-C-methyl-D-erythritol 4-phosphate cytidylyltransferase n=1 Tax=Microbacterium sp. STN6 TaxID=2995588 RepID=UPI0022609C07|nr:2-C-methyl-D-erythritol 4-phosphate cytidylyltransferase [Microbacterium sp. STN6]MCX7523389.1 2-C-methyl-D-erythritol 4-phosphate cytidylyltransferase [Microbacterium sp. STN6]
MTPLPRVAVIIVAAGDGVRLGAGQPKAFVRLSGRTLLERAVEGAAALGEPAQLVVVAPPGRLDEARSLAASAAHASPVTVISGAATRQSSVAAGLALVDPDTETVLVHDAARALAPASLFARVLAAVRDTAGPAVPGLPVTDTIKQTDAAGTILATVDRSALSAVQTPQGFPYAQLRAAYDAADAEYTDDAALAAASGHPARVIEGDPLAFKITTVWDLERAEGLLAERVTTRIGLGTDTHAFGGEGELRLACLAWPGEPALAGHSDGDAVAHAIVDALLSAAGLGDIGSVFGTADPRFENAHGDVFLVETRRLLETNGCRIGNVSVQLVGTRPRFAPRRDEAEQALSEILGAPVSVSGTTTDGLGFTGSGAGVTAIASALIRRLP